MSLVLLSKEQRSYDWKVQERKHGFENIVSDWERGARKEDGAAAGLSKMWNGLTPLGAEVKKRNGERGR